MEQESERIERHIEETREDLGRNLSELEDRVRTTFDWRAQYDRNPWLVLALTFSGGVAISALLSGNGSATRHTNATYSRFAATWSDIQSAVMAAATRRAESFLEEVLPGFREEYQTRKNVSTPMGL
jgi:hypothetical protein